MNSTLCQVFFILYIIELLLVLSNWKFLKYFYKLLKTFKIFTGLYKNGKAFRNF